MYALVLALLKIRTKFIHSGLFRNNYRKGVGRGVTVSLRFEDHE